MVIHVFVRPGRGTKFVRHLSCVTPELVRSCVAVHGNMNRVPVDVEKGKGKQDGEAVREAVLKFYSESFKH